MKKLLFIINPISGTGKKEHIQDMFDRYLDASIYDYETVFTQAPGHATELSKDAAKRGVDIVVAAGGDGSLNETAKGLLHSETALGMLPLGSGNGFARHFDVPLNIREALEVINRGYITSIDTGQINDEMFIGTAGVGFDALVSRQFAEFGRRGLRSYIRVIQKELLHYQPEEYQLNIDGHPLQQKAFMITFANTSQYGNNAVIAPRANASDGLLDVCIVAPFPLSSLPSLLLKLFRKKADTSRYVKTIKGKRISIQRTKKLVHVDGDPKALDTILEIKVNPLSLNIVVPKKQ